ncbi:MAG: hypothetical protein Q8L66_15095 [Caulobacter sp.]|nr:hypothetical protein [Caulobacter sp.]
MTRGIVALTGAAVLLAASGAAWAGQRAVVELGLDSCPSPTAVAATGADGAVVFHNLNPGRYVVSLDAGASGGAVVIDQLGSGRSVAGRLSAPEGGHRFAVDSGGRRIVVDVIRGGGEIRVQLAP